MFCRLGGMDEVNIVCDVLKAHDSQGNKIVEYNIKVYSDNEIILYPVKVSWSKEELVTLARDAFDNSCKYVSFNDWLKNNL